jgi:hypothetical protein
MVMGYLVFKGDLFAVKGGPNPGPHHQSEQKVSEKIDITTKTHNKQDASRRQ